MPYTIFIVLTPAFDSNAGGVQRSTFKMVSYFKKQGHATHVFSFACQGHASQAVAQLHAAPYPNENFEKSNHEALTSKLKSIRPDIVINQMPYEHNIGVTLKKVQAKQHFLLIGCLRNTLFSVVLNLNPYLEGLLPKSVHPFFKNALGRKLALQMHKFKHAKDLKRILNTYDYFVMFGPPNMEEIRYFVGNYKLHKTHLIPNSILKVAPTLPPKEKRILWLSRLSYGQKRADLILPFWKKIMLQLPDWELDVVGDGDAFDDLQQQIKDENLPRVHLYGRQTPDPFYKRAAIYIMTSRNEGFPNTLIEAQAYACVPVVYDSYPICSWVVSKGKSGILIPPFEVDSMAKQVVQLAQDNAQLHHLMQASLSNAKEFLLDNVGEKWISFFDSKIKLEK